MTRFPSRLLAFSLFCVPCAAQEAFTIVPDYLTPDVLVRFDVGTGVITPIGSTLIDSATFSAVTLDLEGRLFAHATSTSGYPAGLPVGLHLLDETTGAATLLGTGGLVPTDRVTGLATEPVTGRLIALGRNVGDLIRTYVLDPVSGVATLDQELAAPADGIGPAGFWIDPTGRRFVACYGSVFHGNPEFAQVYEVTGGALVPLPQELGYPAHAGGQAVGYEPLAGRVWIVGHVGWHFTSVFEVDPDTGAATETISGLDFPSTDLAFPGFDAAEQGTAYCAAAANSTGQDGLLLGAGSVSVARNLFELRATRLPANQFAILLIAPRRDFIPMAGGSQGNLCLEPGTGIGRYPVQSTGGAGTLARQVDLGEIPASTGSTAVQPGETWYFQAWHRDQNPGQTSNFSRGLRVTFE